MKAYIESFKRNSGELAQYFPQDNQASALGVTARERIVKELDGLISNRNRRNNGVGQPGDLQRRCQAISLALVPR